MRTLKTTFNQAALLAFLIGTAGSSMADSPVANIVVYDSDYPNADRPRVVDTRLVDGYTTAIGPYDGFSIEVQRAFPTAMDGFVAGSPLEVDLVLPGNPANYFIFGNYHFPIESTAYFGDAGTYDVLGVEVDPPGGTYEYTKRLQFYAPDNTTQIFYSINGDPEVEWSGEDIYVAEDTTLNYRGVLGPTMGLAKVANYTILFSTCVDSDGDTIPDRVEVELGLSPLEAQADFNNNTLDDFDEYIRGANAFLPMDPNFLPPLWIDTDGDTWTDYDEGLRGTAAGDADDFPAAANLQTVEIMRSGDIDETPIGASAPPVSPSPDLPFPASYEVDVTNASGVPRLPAVQSAGLSFSYRTSGEQFHYIRARALDGSGRVILGVEPPLALCIDFNDLCPDAGSPSDWRDAYKAQYESMIYDSSAGAELSARTMAEALLLNRYYEINANAEFLPAVENQGPDLLDVADLRSRRNEAALYVDISNAVSTNMIDLVNDYLRFYTAPQQDSLLKLLTDHFAGRAVDAQMIPDGVREANIDVVANQVGLFFNALPAANTVLMGELNTDQDGFLLSVGPDTYRLDGLADAWPDGTIITVDTLIDINNCGFDPIPALVTEVLNIELPPLPEEVDTDNDMLGDDWEQFYFGDLDEDAEGDFDGDNQTNGEEYENGTNPAVKSIGSLISDGWFMF